MGDLPKEPEAPAPSCGNCKFGKPNGANLDQIVCFGGPPVPVMMGARQVGMKMEFQIECLRPAIPRSSPPCSLHQSGSSVLIIGR